MSNLQNYTKATVTWEGALLTEESSVTVQRMSGAQQVKTVAKGFAGPSPGAPMMTIQVSNAVPSADFELNPGQAIKLNTIGEITIFAAGRTLTTKGYIDGDNFSHAVETASKLDFTVIAQYADWE